MNTEKTQQLYMHAKERMPGGVQLLSKRPEMFAPYVSVSLSSFDLDVCKRIIAEQKSKDLFWQITVKSLLTLLISSVFRAVPALRIYDGNNDSEYIDKRFEYIDNFFDQNIINKVNKSELAKGVNLSPRQLDRVFKTYYGMNFREKLHSVRMEKAQYLLRTTDYPLSKISELCGYNSEPSFFKLFKMKYNTTPHEYRKKYYNKTDV